MLKTINDILIKVYGRFYDEYFLGVMAEHIVAGIQRGSISTQGDVFYYIFCNTSGGTTAEHTAGLIAEVTPIAPTMERTRARMV